MSSPADIDPDEDARQRHLQMLRDVGAMAMDLARKLHASADEPDADLGEIATKYARVARAVRQTIALEQRILERRPMPAPAPRVWEDETTPEQDAGEERLAEVREVFGEAADRAGRSRTGLENDLDEWLFDQDDLAPFAGLSYEAIIERLCTDLGLPAEFGEKALDHHLTDCLPYQQVERRRLSGPPPPAGAGDREAVVGAAAPQTLAADTS